jgi:uncharacterized protein YutE (UPF0331/DUF86 family)
VSHERPLVRALRHEFVGIEKEAGLASRLNTIRRQTELDDVQIRAAATAIHSVYTGIERCLVLLCKHNGVAIPASAQWHRSLLSVTQEAGLISESLHSTMKEFVAFRHFFRHAYGYMLDVELLAPLLDDLPTMIEQARTELLGSQ